MQMSESGSAPSSESVIAEPPRHPRRLVFLGTPDDAVPTLLALHEAGFEIPLVVSQPDRRRGRGKQLVPSPVKAAASGLGIAVSSELADVLGVEADLAVVVAYGEIIPTSMLEELPMVNLHFSLLPRWRGAAPVERAILAGDEQTGVCVMQLAPKLDTGAVYRRSVVAIDDRITAAELRSKLADLGARAMTKALSDGLDTPIPQDGEVVYAAKFEPHDFEIDFSNTADQVMRLIRIGGAFTTFRGERFKIWEAEAIESDLIGQPGTVAETTTVTGEGALELVMVQPAGKPRMAASAWANGAHLQPNDRFGP